MLSSRQHSRIHSRHSERHRHRGRSKFPSRPKSVSWKDRQDPESNHDLNPKKDTLSPSPHNDPRRRWRTGSPVEKTRGGKSNIFPSSLTPPKPKKIESEFTSNEGPESKITLSTLQRTPSAHSLIPKEVRENCNQTESFPILHLHLYSFCFLLAEAGGGGRIPALALTINCSEGFGRPGNVCGSSLRKGS